jgi:hypothetical protein
LSPHTTSEYIGVVDTDEVDDDKEDWNMDVEDNGAEESEEDEVVCGVQDNHRDGTLPPNENH